MHEPAVATPETVLRGVFGYQSFRPGQREIIDTVLAGRDCIGVMPTGSGKSLTFQIPARILDGTVLVLSPLISLMKDQVDGLLANGFRATAINSSIESGTRPPWRSRMRRHAPCIAFALLRKKPVERMSCSRSP